jgi:hypothetical protein
MNRHWSMWCFIMVCLAGGPAWAVDHNNLDEGRPLRLEDAYPIAYGELSSETGARVSLNRQSPDRVAFPVELLYGAYWNLHLGLGSTLATEPRTIDEAEKSGDLRAFAFYNFNQETLRLPAFGAKLSLDFPTGINSRGVDTELKGIMTRSFGQFRTHLNAGYEFIGHAADGARSGRYELGLGAQYPLGYPRFFNTTVLADIFTLQSVHTGESSPIGIELGIRRQAAPLTVLDVGIGTEFAGPAERTPFFFTMGVSVGF